MTNIYQRIWNADQGQNGVQPILDNQSGDKEKGYVKVNSNLDSDNVELRVLPEVQIPESKKRTYELCQKLFDNYALSEKDEEFDTPEEREEIHAFVSAIIDTPPMQIAREYIAEQTGTSLSKERFYNTIMEMWFRKFSQTGEPHLSGFEHVVVGEQDGPKAQGYHFWYKYYLDDGFARETDGIYKNSFPGLNNDRIKYSGSKQTGEQEQYPESVTISFKWDAADYERKALRPLQKKIGGFFVGCSVEGLLALGTVRAHKGINAPGKAVINGAEYDLKLYHSSDNKHIRTFYPKFLHGIEPPVPVDPPEPEPPFPTDSSSVRIIAALINPKGNDVGKEAITLINIGTEDIFLDEWSFADKNENKSIFSIHELKAGDTHKIILDGRGAQLSNKGGRIKLLNKKNQMVHMVSYSKGQVNTQGSTIIC